MVDQSHPSHFSPDRLQHPGREVIFLAKRSHSGQELILSVFQFEEDGQEDFLVVPVAWEEQPGQVAEILNSGYFVVIEFYLGVYHVFHLGLFGPNVGFVGVVDCQGDVKIHLDC